MKGNSKPYAVEIRLGAGQWRHLASYKTLDKALRVIAIWKQQYGAVDHEPFDARLKV